MDKYAPPSLFVPVIASLFAAAMFSLSRIQGFSDGTRAFFVLIGVLCAGVAFVTGMNWLFYVGGQRLEELRSAWYAPTILLAEYVSRMNHEQILVYEQVSPFRAVGRLTPGGMSWDLWTPGGDLPMGWVSNYLEQCQVSYPLLLAQHGLPDNLERDRRARLHALLVQNGFAEPARGAHTVRLTVPLATVLEKLDLVE